jgi:hypothetical protein
VDRVLSSGSITHKEKKMPTVEREDIRAELAEALGREAIRFIEQAAALGWRVLTSNHGQNVTLVPIPEYDNPSRRIHLSVRGRNNTSQLMKMHKRVVRYSLIQKFKEEGKLPPEVENMSIDRIVAGMRENESGAFLAAMGDQALASDDQNLIALPTEKPKERFVKPIPTPAEVAAKQKAARHIISERPAIMHAGAGRGYPSKTTIERKWSDGTTDYACALDTCGEISNNRRAFAGAHWGMHIRKGEADFATQDLQYIEDPSHQGTQGYTKANYRLNKLKQLLAGIDLTKMPADDLAEQIDEYLRRDTDDVPSEPLTAEQVVDRIRRIVDRGHYTEQEQRIAELAEQIDQVTLYADQQIADAEERANAQTQRANALEETLGALQELLAGVMPVVES